jgi:hypothetical protein
MRIIITMPSTAAVPIIAFFTWYPSFCRLGRIWIFRAFYNAPGAVSIVVANRESKNQGDWRRETGGRKAGNRKQETGNRKQETGNRKQETGNRKQEDRKA